MDDALPILFKGSPGSPYTRKMLALRYRRLPYRLLLGNHDDDFDRGRRSSSSMRCSRITPTNG